LPLILRERALLRSTEFIGDAYLCERAGVKLVLGSDFQSNIAASRAVPGCLCASLDLTVHLVVVACAEDGEVVGSSDSSAVLRLRVRSSKRILCDRGFAHIIPGLCTNEETLVADGSVEGCSGTLEDIGEQTCLDVLLLVDQVELAAIGLLDWEVVGEDLGFEALCQVVFELELGVKGVGGCPGLGESQTWLLSALGSVEERGG
jgi:hypothetical protein